MQVAVWDTYVTKKDGTLMHFDIIAPDHIQDEKIIYTFGKEYLQTKHQEGQILSARECRFCHIEKASPAIEASIAARGYYIFEIQNCQ